MYLFHNAQGPELLGWMLVPGYNLNIAKSWAPLPLAVTWFPQKFSLPQLASTLTARQQSLCPTPFSRNELELLA